MLASLMACYGTLFHVGVAPGGAGSGGDDAADGDDTKCVVSIRNNEVGWVGCGERAVWRGADTRCVLGQQMPHEVGSQGGAWVREPARDGWGGGGMQEFMILPVGWVAWESFGGGEGARAHQPSHLLAQPPVRPAPPAHLPLLPTSPACPRRRCPGAGCR
jgi:hypothetical protein